MPNPSGTKRVVLKRPNGTLAIDIPIQTIADDPAQLSTHITRLLADHPTWSHEGTVEVSALPTRHPRTRKAWRWNAVSVAVEVDLPAARTTIMEQTRLERNRRLTKSDGMQLRANEVGTAQDQTDWNNHRQSLRDLTTTVQTDIDALATAAALETYAVPWPTPPEAQQAESPAFPPT